MAIISKSLLYDHLAIGYGRAESPINSQVQRGQRGVKSCNIYFNNWEEAAKDLSALRMLRQMW